MKLIPYNQGKYEEKTILILISGYFSCLDEHSKEWQNLITSYTKRFKNPIIIFIIGRQVNLNLVNYFIIGEILKTLE